MNTFDYIVIGGGSGGIATANRAAEYGKKMADTLAGYARTNFNIAD